MVLAAITLAVYWPVAGYECLNYDDPVYFSSNYSVQTGLSWKTVKWSFTTLDAGFWQPLTWLSYMLDVELFGRGSRGPHTTNLLLHATNTVLLFFLLKRLTGLVWQSAMVAALFALHPLHVEPVAWVSSRKDLLSTFSGLIALGFYVRYASTPSLRDNHSPSTSGLYWMALLFFAASLMSKSMLVTLPFVMLLLDYWPLQRFTIVASKSRPSVVWKLAREKLPFVVLALLSTWLTVHAEKSAGAISSLEDFPALTRIANGAVSCSGYIWQTFWPAGLAVHYPYPKSFSVWQVTGSFLILLAITAYAVWESSRRSWLVVGWLWYLVTLLPVSGLVQIGNQAHADRYTYVPLIGLFIIVVWGANEVFRFLKPNKAVIVAIAVPVLVACAVRTASQLNHWQNSETLFQHTLAVTKNNVAVRCNLGIYLVANGRVEEGIDHLRKAVQADPHDGVSLSNLGAAVATKGSLDEAKDYCLKAVDTKPDCAEFLGALGSVLALRKEYDEAVARFEAALRLKPKYVAGRVSFGKVLALQQRYEEAISQYTEALRLSPGNPEAHFNLGLALAVSGNSEGAMQHYSEALRCRPDYVEAHNKLADSLLMAKHVDEAGLHYRQSLRLNPAQPAVRFNLGNVLALQKNYEGAIAQFTEAVRLAPDHAPAHKNLGLALARLGRRDEAIAYLAEALRLKPDYQEAKQQLRALGVDPPE
jgi:tetratricopeptide (TPR) repeat protein